MATMALFIAAVPAAPDEFEEAEQDGKSPVIGIHRIRLSLRRKPPGNVEVKFRKNLLRRFLLEAIDNDKDCVDIKKVRPTNCSCIGDIHQMSEAEAVGVINYLFGYALLPKSEQQTLVMEWIKYGENISNAYRRGEAEKKRKFLLPGCSHLICKDALCKMLGIGHDAWSTISKMVKNNEPPSHGLIGKASNRAEESTEMVLKEYFEELMTMAME
jgi:hypothetical protein